VEWVGYLVFVMNVGQIIRNNTVMKLRREDIEKISKIIENFSEVEEFELEEFTSIGLGKTLEIHFDQAIDGIVGRFSVEVSGSDDW